MGLIKRIEWKYKFGGNSFESDKIVFSKEMLIDFIGLFWYEFFFDENDKIVHNVDDVIATAREVGKSYVVVAIIIYLFINNPDANFVLTRKYGTAAGSFYEMFNQVLNDFQDKYQIEFSIDYYETKEFKNGKIKEKLVRSVNKLKGKGMGSLFSFGKTGDDKSAIFFNDSYDVTKNGICFLRGADDADGTRGLSVNRGYIIFNFLEEYSQEVDSGKLDPDVQVTRYKSLWKSANRYSVKMAGKNGYPQDLKTKQLAAANIWDPTHLFNENLLKAIPEKEWREFVEADPENNFVKIVEVDGIKYMRATPAINTFLYPRGSEKREALIEVLLSVIEHGSDYDKAEMLGYTFPGFLKDDNPLATVIMAIIDAPTMTLKELYEEGFSIEDVEFGTDPGLRDNAGSLATSYITNDYTGEDGVYFGEIFVIENKERKRRKQPRISNPKMKKMFLEFWNRKMDELIERDNHGSFIDDHIYVNMDMKALGIRDDFNDELFPNNKKTKGIDGTCMLIPTHESKGYGLEQRPEILAKVIENSIWDPITKGYVIEALKTLELYAIDKKQPHPRKGNVDVYDIICYGIVNIRSRIR